MTFATRSDHFTLHHRPGTHAELAVESVFIPEIKNEAGHADSRETSHSKPIVDDESRLPDQLVDCPANLRLPSFRIDILS